MVLADASLRTSFNNNLSVCTLYPKHGIKIQGIKPLPSSVQISAAVTAHARIAMSRFMALPGNPVLYSDTDSLFLQHELTPELAAAHVSPQGNELGKLKYEGKLHKLVVWKPKHYAYLNAKNEPTVTISSGNGDLTHAQAVRAVVNPDSEVYYHKEATLKRDIQAGGVRVVDYSDPTLLRVSRAKANLPAGNEIRNGLGEDSTFAKYTDQSLLPGHLMTKRRPLWRRAPWFPPIINSRVRAAGSKDATPTPVA